MFWLLWSPEPSEVNNSASTGHEIHALAHAASCKFSRLAVENLPETPLETRSLDGQSTKILLSRAKVTCKEDEYNQVQVTFTHLLVCGCN